MVSEHKLLTVKALSQYLGISEDTLSKYRTKGTGPKYLKLGRVIRYKLSDVHEWIEEKIQNQTYPQNQ